MAGTSDRSHRGLRAARGGVGPRRLLRPARLHRGHVRPCQDQVSGRRARSGHDGLVQPAVLSYWSSTVSPTRSSTAWPRRNRFVATSRGSTTSARIVPTSSTPSSNSCSTKRPSRAVRPGPACSTRPSRPCASTSTARRFRSNRPSASCRTRSRSGGRAPPKPWPRPWAASAHLRADHQHAEQGPRDLGPVARSRGRGRFAASVEQGRARRRRRPRVGRRGGASAALAPILQAEGALVRPRHPEPLGPQCASAPGASPDRALERGARHGTRRLRQLLAGARQASPSGSSTTAGSMRPCGPARRPAPSRTRRCRACTLTFS